MPVIDATLAEINAKINKTKTHKTKSNNMVAKKVPENKYVITIPINHNPL